MTYISIWFFFKRSSSALKTDTPDICPVPSLKLLLGFQRTCPKCVSMRSENLASRVDENDGRYDLMSLKLEQVEQRAYFLILDYPFSCIKYQV
jgi:hypothetical protein